MLGRYDHTIDAKGRIIIPAKYREQMGDKFYVTRGLDECLFVYAPDEWEKFENHIKELPIGSKEARKINRFFFVGATDDEVDRQGRIMIPAHLREYAHLEKNVILAGVGNHLEIWDPATYDAKNNFDDIEDIAESMEGFCF